MSRCSQSETLEKRFLGDTAAGAKAWRHDRAPALPCLCGGHMGFIPTSDTGAIGQAEYNQRGKWPTHSGAPCWPLLDVGSQWVGQPLGLRHLAPAGGPCQTEEDAKAQRG